jgi:carbon monoxide dehydrogenase subunit G
MKLENEFRVHAPLDRTWATLLDIERVARCIPGARLEPDASGGVHRGEMHLKLGALSLAYKGTARLAEVEEDEHVATIEATARELKGAGTARARIRNDVRPDDDGSTRVKVVTDLNVTGRPAQFGRGIMEDVAATLLDDFAQRLEREILAEPAPSGAQAAPAAGAGTGAPSAEPTVTEVARPAEPEALDLGAVVARPLARRAVAGAAGAAVLGLLLVLAARLRRPRGLTVTIRYR